MKNNTYYPQLNALRGIGVISVFIYHSYKPNFGGGIFMSFTKFCYESIYLSMDMFFALSSFIITHLALKEIEKTQKFSFKNFMLRRVFRIWPIYFLILLFTYSILSYFAEKYSIPITLPPASFYFLFVSNFYLPGHVFFLRQLWTISVEEQFYVIWGLTVLYFKTNLKPAIFLLATISVVFNLYNAIKNIDVYFHTISYFFDMMCGSFFALLIYKKSRFITLIASESNLKTICLYLFLPIYFVIYFVFDKYFIGTSNNILDVIMRIIFIIHHCMIFVDQMYNSNSIFNLSRQKFFTFAGEIAYGVYCFHGVVLTVGFYLINKYQINVHPIFVSLIMFIVSIAVGSISYKYIEKPIINLKYKLKTI